MCDTWPNHLGYRCGCDDSEEYLHWFVDSRQSPFRQLWMTFEVANWTFNRHNPQGWPGD